MTKTVKHTQTHLYLQDGNAIIIIMLWDLNEGKHLYIHSCSGLQVNSTCTKLFYQSLAPSLTLSPSLPPSLYPLVY